MNKLTYEYVKEQVEKESYKLLSKKYVNSEIKLKVQCDKSHIYKVTYGNFQKGRRCPICAGKLKLTYEYVKEQIKKECYKLLSKSYVNNCTKLKVQCDKGHNYKVKWNDFQQGHRCPICCQKYSKIEKEILKIVKHLLPNENIIENDRTQIVNPLIGKNLELDIWIPELKKAIEFNGRYWHISDYAKYKDAEKINQCKKKGIDLLVINEQDWIDDKNKYIKKLKLWFK